MRPLSVVLFVIILAGSVHASDVLSHTLQREEYAPGETVLMGINLKQQPEKGLTPLNIALRDAAQRSVRISPFLIRSHENKYMVFFDIPQSAVDGGYEVVIKDALFKVGGILQRAEYAIPLKIKKHSPVISIFPTAVVLERKKTFTIRVYALEQTTLTIEGSSGVNNVYTTGQPMLPRTERIFKLSVGDRSGPEESVTIRYGNYTYAIPIFIRQDQGEEVNETVHAQESIVFVTEINEIEREITQNQVIEGVIEINNSGAASVLLRVEVDPLLAPILSVQAPASIAPGGQAVVVVKINEEKSPKKDFFEGTLKITAGRTSKTIPVKIALLPEGGGPPVLQRQNEKNKTKEEIITPPLFEVNLTQSEAQQQRSLAGVFVFLLILLFIALVVYALSRRTTKKKTFDEYIREIQKK